MKVKKECNIDLIAKSTLFLLVWLHRVQNFQEEDVANHYIQWMDGSMDVLFGPWVWPLSIGLYIGLLSLHKAIGCIQTLASFTQHLGELCRHKQSNFPLIVAFLLILMTKQSHHNCRNVWSVNWAEGLSWSGQTQPNLFAFWKFLFVSI